MASPTKPSSQKEKTKASSKLDGRGLNSIATMGKFQKFLPYSLDFVGIVLISMAIILLLGFFGVTSGVIITPLANFLARWFGLGRFLILITLIVIGYKLIRWREKPPEDFNLGRTLAFEFSFFLLLAIFSFFDATADLKIPMGQKYGGIIGWGVAEIFSVIFGDIAGKIVIGLIFIISVFIALEIVPKFDKFVQSRLQKRAYQSAENQQIGSITKPAVVTSSNKQAEKEKRKTQPTPWLPPEFRKSFETHEIADEKPNQPLRRDEDLPPMNLLEVGETYKPDKRTINMTAGLIEKTLNEFGIPAKVVGFRSGPTVTQFAVEPGYIDKSDEERQKIRVSQIMSLQRDLTLALSADRLRIEAPVPGKSYVGIEIPNPNSANVQMRPLIESEAFFRINSPLALSLGRDVSGRPVVADLATMPHLLIAGTTGSGKSVCITALTACLVMNNTPEDLKLAMIDPKRVELMRFNGLPHLMGNVETEIERILGVLRWATTEMDYRYKLLEKARARNIDSYNLKMERRNKPKLPKIVILIDELADLMISAPDQTEHAVIRLAQKARAIGIHLILATQRPSTDVVTGLIKANFPTRISFTVASSIDSRVILDTNGAETLLGRGDMLFLHPEIGLPMRAQGVIVSDKELKRVIKWWQKKSETEEKTPKPRYDDTDAPPWEERIGLEEDDDDEDEVLIEEAIRLIKSEGHASASYFQRQLRIGYPRAARLVDQLEEMGVIGPSQGGGREREILLDMDEEDY